MAALNIEIEQSFFLFFLCILSLYFLPSDKSQFAVRSIGSSHLIFHSKSNNTNFKSIFKSTAYCKFNDIFQFFLVIFSLFSPKLNVTEEVFAFHISTAYGRR